jgi:hypothetical protein
MEENRKPNNTDNKKDGPPVSAMKPENLAPPTGMEGREADLATAMQVLVKQ